MRQTADTHQEPLFYAAQEVNVGESGRKRLGSYPNRSPQGHEGFPEGGHSL